jgi:hypothetical protein
MNHRIEIKTAVPLNNEEIVKWTEEAAFFNWLNRTRYAQPGNELDDWLSAEKELQESLLADPLFSKARSA